VFAWEATGAADTAVVWTDETAVLVASVVAGAADDTAVVAGTADDTAVVATTADEVAAAAADDVPVVTVPPHAASSDPEVVETPSAVAQRMKVRRVISAILLFLPRFVHGLSRAPAVPDTATACRNRRMLSAAETFLR